MPKPAAPLASALTFALLGLGLAYSCSSNGGPDEVPFSPERQEVLRAVGKCTVDATTNFAEQAKKLREALDSHAEDPSDADRLDAAQSAWKSAMSTWQLSELAQFGPSGLSSAVESGGAIGGQDLRDQIYSWPLINSCRVDRALVTKEYEELEDLDVNAKGLDTLEYLLFNHDEDSTCAATVDIVSEGSWEKLDDLQKRRADYALSIAQEVEANAKKLREAWDTDKGDFYSELVNAGQSGGYPNQAEAIDAVVRALMYLDVVVKDLKLGEPMGQGVSCPDDQCPDDFEHQFAGVSKSSIEQNLAGFASLYRGCDDESYGFDQLLKDTDQELIDEDITAALTEVEKALEAIEEEDLRKTQKDHPEQLTALFDAIKKITDVLKNELADTLGAVLHTVDGDND